MARHTTTKSSAQLDREIAEALAHNDTPFSESPAKKARWLRQAKRRFPEGSFVRVVKSDEPAYVDVYGTVAGYDLGGTGDWPLVRVQLERHGTDAFYGDGNKDDEIVSVSPKAIAAMFDDDESVALDLVMQGRSNGSATEALHRLVPDESRRNFIKWAGSNLKMLRAR